MTAIDGNQAVQVQLDNGGSRRLFSSPATEPRARRGSDVILLAVALVGLAVASTAAFPPPGFMVAIADLLDSAPRFLETAWQISADLVAVFAVFLLLAALVRHRFDLVRDLVAAIVVATVLWVCLGRWVQGQWPPILPSLRFTRPPSWYPSPKLALPASIIITAAPHLTRPVRRLGRWLLAFSCLGVTALGATSLLGAVAGVLVGAASASLIHLAFGSSAGRPSVHDVQRTLQQIGVEVRSLSPADRQAAGSFELLGNDTNGEPLIIKVYGRDAHDSALATTLWRSIWYHEPGSPLRFGRLQQVEHEALVTLLAAQAGVVTDQVITAGATADDDAILVMRGRGVVLTSAFPIDADQPGQRDEQDHLIDQLWGHLGLLHRGGIAHGAVDRHALIVDDQLLGMVDFSGGGVGVSQGRINADRAQALLTVALLVGVPRAVASAQRALGDDGLQPVLPYIQRATFTPSQRRAIKAKKVDLDELRKVAAEAAGVEPPQLQQLRRITAGMVLKVALPGLAVVAIMSAFSGLEMDGVLDQIVDATWWLLAIGLIVAQLPRLTQSLSTLGASPTPLPLGPVYALQLAMSYIAIAVPSYAARVATSMRFLQRHGVPSGAALAAGALDTVTTFVLQCIGIGGLLLFTSASLDLDLRGASDAAGNMLLIAAIVLLVVGVLVAVIPRLRRAIVGWVRQTATEAMTVVRGLSSPRRLALLIGGNIGTEMMFTITLGIIAQAMGTTVPFADLVLIHLSVSLLSGLIPVPGGVGVAEAMLTYGLIRTGMPDEAAFATAISYRAATFYLPPIWGFFALRWLQRAQHL